MKTLERHSMSPQEFAALEAKQQYALKQYTRRELEEQAEKHRKYE